MLKKELLSIIKSLKTENKRLTEMLENYNTLKTNVKQLDNQLVSLIKLKNKNESTISKLTEELSTIKKTLGNRDLSKLIKEETLLNLLLKQDEFNKAQKQINEMIMIAKHNLEG